LNCLFRTVYLHNLPRFFRVPYWIFGSDIWNSTSLPEQQFAGRHVAPLITHYSDSEPISLCSYFLVLHAKRRSNKYLFYSLVSANRGSNPDLPYSRQVH